MRIRFMTEGDLESVLSLFQNTVLNVNILDYTDDQTELWSRQERWTDDILNHHALVAVIDDRIIGFGSLSPDGTIEMMYVHHEYQGQKIASRLLEKLEDIAVDLGFFDLKTEASITAKPFFENKDFVVVNEQKEYVEGVPFTNFVMRKKMK